MLKALLLFVVIVPSVLGHSELRYCPVVKDFEKEYNTEQEKCLATMVYGEARGESLQGQVAVAFTALNRAGKAQNKTVCNVVLAPKQYSIFNNNPALQAAALSPHLEPTQKNIIDQESWKQALIVAQKVMRNQADDPTFGATHYLAPKLMVLKKFKYPKWSKQYKMVVMIDGHKFYKSDKL